MNARLLALCLLLPIPLAAQSNAARMANDAYTRSHDYDLIHQLSAVRNLDGDSTSLAGRVITTLVALRPGLDSVILDAGKRLEVWRVADAKGTALRTAARGDTLVGYPARPLAFHDTLRFTIDYHARIDNGHGLTFIQPEGREHRPQQIWSQGEDHDNHFWFPTYVFPNDKMTWELAATVPAEYSVVSNGRLVTDRKSPGGTHTVTWRQDRPSATYLVSLIVAPLVKFADAWRRVPVGQVRPDDRRGLLRRHGERERHDARRLAARRSRLPRPSLVPVDPHPARAGASVVRRLHDDRELGEHVAQRGVRGVHAGPVLGREARPPRRGRLLPRRIPAVPADRRPAAHAARRARLEQHLPQGRPDPADAAALPGRRALLGLHQPLSQAPRARQRHDRRPAPGGARGDGREPRLVLGRVDVSGGPPPVHRHHGLRHQRPQADPDRQTDAGRLREGGQHGAQVRDAAAVPHAAGRPVGNGKRRRGETRGPDGARADDRDRGTLGRPDDGRVRRRQRDPQGADVRPAHRMAGHPAGARSRPLESPMGDRAAGAAHRRHGGRGGAWPGGDPVGLFPHAGGGSGGARSLPRERRSGAARRRAPGHVGTRAPRRRRGPRAAGRRAGGGARPRDVPWRPELRRAGGGARRPRPGGFGGGDA